MKELVKAGHNEIPKLNHPFVCHIFVNLKKSSLVAMTSKVPKLCFKILGGIFVAFVQANNTNMGSLV